MLFLKKKKKMGFINFLKKVTGINRVEKSKRKTEKVTFDDIGNLIEDKIKKIEDKENKIFILIKNKISVTIKELDEKVRVLENIDIDSIKSEDRIKLIVKGNLNNYIQYVKNLTEKLYNLKEENFEKFIAVLNEVFLDFDKKSHMSYQKATFLIGNEIAVIREIIINFSKYLEKVFKENKDIIDSSKIIYFIKLKLEEIDEIKENIRRVDEKNRYLDKEIKNIKETNKGVLEEIDEIKKKDSYIENLKKQEEIKLKVEELKKEIFKFREIIDFKALGDIFHVSKEKIDIIKAHKEDFQTVFQKDDGANILSLIDEAKLNNGTISAKIKQINDKKEEIIKNKATIKKDETEDLLAGIKKIKLKIENLNNEKEKELKRCERFKLNRKNIINSIKQELIKINVIISDA